MKLKRGDRVKIISGKDRGKSGKVLQVLVDRQRVSVEGVNLRYKNMRPRRQGESGQRIQFPAPLAVANVVLVCPACGKTTRVGYRQLENRKKVRICRKCKESLP
ncbi:MAG: 50S ribosomal protein L24 [Candidatus Buchananbacteria bacterium RIFCSPLOWO2_01_FULL_56_15]|uniref:Large ribosomal subunit protein uL24 n=2 Tax=Candidatus Buchananiibacteriota TaxID=1817903 RepID=A0A1G1YJC7_9BACT|nr:MAG: 50S ribosomal protein L24 [Candidatus Buchananbacteria bacterium RIFCSPHIGHO2_02_FULL_56_16]OGY54897.1 MAG: 50S ribosomal protein L24 [Candidatus Buchananbacteria bacterium RIFCSPLOWO2_01_FULL_56_15]